MGYNLKDVDLCFINPIVFVLHKVWNVVRGMTDVGLVLKELGRAAYFQPYLSLPFYPLADRNGEGI